MYVCIYIFIFTQSYDHEISGSNGSQWLGSLLIGNANDWCPNWAGLGQWFKAGEENVRVIYCCRRTCAPHLPCFCLMLQRLLPGKHMAEAWLRQSSLQHQSEPQAKRGYVTAIGSQENLKSGRWICHHDQLWRFLEASLGIPGTRVVTLIQVANWCSAHLGSFGTLVAGATCKFMVTVNCQTRPNPFLFACWVLSQGWTNRANFSGSPGSVHQLPQLHGQTGKHPYAPHMLQAI